MERLNCTAGDYERAMLLSRKCYTGRTAIVKKMWLPRVDSFRLSLSKPCRWEIGLFLICCHLALGDREYNLFELEPIIIGRKLRCRSRDIWRAIDGLKEKGIIKPVGYVPHLETAGYGFSANEFTVAKTWKRAAIREREAYYASLEGC